MIEAIARAMSAGFALLVLLTATTFAVAAWRREGRARLPTRFMFQSGAEGLQRQTEAERRLPTSLTLIIVLEGVAASALPVIWLTYTYLHISLDTPWAWRFFVGTLLLTEACLAALVPAYLLFLTCVIETKWTRILSTTTGLRYLWTAVYAGPAAILLWHAIRPESFASVGLVLLASLLACLLGSLSVVLAFIPASGRRRRQLGAFLLAFGVRDLFWASALLIAPVLELEGIWFDISLSPFETAWIILWPVVALVFMVGLIAGIERRLLGMRPAVVRALAVALATLLWLTATAIVNSFLDQHLRALAPIVSSILLLSTLPIHRWLEKHVETQWRP